VEPPTLVWVGLVVTDVAATALTLARDFGLTRGDWAADPGGRTIPVLGVGACALALFTPADPLLGGAAAPGVHHLALGVPDLARAAQEAAELGLRPAAAEPGLAGARRVALALGATAGVRTWLTEAVPAPGPGGGRVARLDHVGAALADNAAALDAFTTRLGCPIESTQTDLEARIPVESFTSDRYGVVQHAREPELVGGLRVAFVTVGDADLELLRERYTFDAATSADSASVVVLPMATATSPVRGVMYGVAACGSHAIVESRPQQIVAAGNGCPEVNVQP